MVKIDKIIRSKRKTVGLEINRNAELIVRAPKAATLEQINKIVDDKSNWILRKQREFIENGSPPKKFIDGELFYFLGEEYPLDIVSGVDFVLDFNGRKFLLSKDYAPFAKDVFIEWYSMKGRHILPKIASEIAEKAGLKYQKIKVSRANKRWGSCSAKGNINFSWRLVMTPPEIVEYIVVHELAHLVEMNHSKRFWAIVAAIAPNAKQRDKWINKNGWKFYL